MTDIELRRLAEAAHASRHGIGWAPDLAVAISAHEAFIEALDPQTVLALLDRIELGEDLCEECDASFPRCAPDHPQAEHDAPPEYGPLARWWMCGKCANDRAQKWATERQSLLDRIDAVRALHVIDKPMPWEYEDGEYCRHDGFVGPCPTIRALDGAG